VKNKKAMFAVILISAMVMMAACGGAATGGPATETAGTGGAAAAANGTPGPGGFEMGTLMKLALATFKLEDTDQAVTAEQAQALLPLWQAVQALGQSDTTAAAEMAAVEQQLHDSYTAEQLSAIEALALTPQDMAAIMESLGLTFGNFGAGTPEPGATPGLGFPGGGFVPPDGGFVPGGQGGGPGGGLGPGGQGGGPGGINPQDLSPEAQATFEARRAAGGAGAGRGGAGVPGPLLNAVIELLQDKAQ
jgi:hypothetical protein